MTLLIIYSSTSGNTEYTVDVLAKHLRGRSDMEIKVQRVEESKPENMKDCDILMFACGTWNSVREGQLSPGFIKFVSVAKEFDLEGKGTCVIGLGDDRYFYTCKSTAHLMQFAREIGGKNLLPPLPIVNDPYGQEEKIIKWGDKLLSAIQK